MSQNRYDSKMSDRSPSNFHRTCPRRYVKNGGAIDRGGEFFAPSPVIGGLTWSDSSLAERAALLPCKPRPLGLAMADEDGIVSVSKPTDGILHIILPSVWVGTKAH